MKRFYYFLSCLLAPSLFCQSREELVREKLEIVLSELEKSGPEPWELPRFFQGLLDFLARGSVLFRLIFFLGAVGLILFLLYGIAGYLLKNPSFRRKGSAPALFEKEGDGECSPDSRAREARAAAEAGDYSLAVLLLHRGSVEFLFLKGFLKKGRDYTNREILSLAGDSGYGPPFARIASAAERVLFNGSEERRDDFLKLEDDYGRHFS